MLVYARLMYIMLRGLYMDDDASLTLTSVTIISPRYCSLHLEYIFTAEHVLSRMVSS
jgi:hypothetical protein